MSYVEDAKSWQVIPLLSGTFEFSMRERILIYNTCNVKNNQVVDFCYLSFSLLIHIFRVFDTDLERGYGYVQRS